MSPAWDALDISRAPRGNGDSLLRAFGPSIQTAVFDERELAKGRYVLRNALGNSLRRLEGQAGLQSLAATVLLLRKAYADGHKTRAFTIGRSLHRTLLMAAVASPLKLISLELFEYFIRYIFPMAAEEEFEMDLDRNTLQSQSEWLRRTASDLHMRGRSGFSLVGNTRQLRRLLQLDFGFDLLYGLGPRLRTLMPPEAVHPRLSTFVSENNARCDWGASILASGKCVRMPPGRLL